MVLYSEVIHYERVEPNIASAYPFVKEVILWAVKTYSMYIDKGAQRTTSTRLLSIALIAMIACIAL